GFLPCPGRILALRVPGGPGIRDDSGVEEGDEVPSYYDPLVSKLVAWGEDRASAIARMRRAVREYKVLGIKTTLPFFERVLRHPDFLAGRIDTSFVERLGREKQAEEERPWAVAAAAAAIGALARRRAARTTPGAGPGGCRVLVASHDSAVDVLETTRDAVLAPRGPAGPARLVAPMPGRIVRVLAEPGQEVEAGQGLVVMEAMKMENELRSPRAGRVVEVHAREL